MRIKCHPERLIQTALGKYIGDVGLPAAFCVPQHLDLIGATLRNEDISIRRGAQISGIAKAFSVHLDLKTGRHLELCTRRTLDDARPVNCPGI